MKHDSAKKLDSIYSSIVTLIKGSIIAQIITLLATPLLTRIYSPEELGVYTLIITAESMFGTIICARFESLIVSESNEDKVNILVKLSFIVSLILSVIFSLAYSYIFIIRDAENSEYKYVFIFILVLLIINGVIRILDSLNNRNQSYKLMTTVFVIRSTFQNIGAVLLGVMNSGVWGLIVSHTGALFFGLRKQSLHIKDRIEDITKVNVKQLKQVFKENYRQPLYSAPAVFMNKFSYSSITLVIGYLYGLSTLGYYSISYKVLGVPLTVLSNNISRVFLRSASIEYKESGNFIKAFRKVSLLLILISLPLVLFLYFIFPIIVELIFGKGWSVAGEYVQILAPMFGIRLVVSAVSTALQIVNKQNIEFALQGVFIIISVGCFMLASYFQLNVDTYLITIAISFSIIYLIYYMVIYRYARGMSSTT